MIHRPHKLLLVILAIALAAAPLRGSLAVPAAPAPAGDDHCASMMDGAHPAGGHAQTADQPAGHNCDYGCDGGCCDGACTACAHATPALPDSHTLASSTHVPVPAPYFIDLLLTRPPYPLLRPPITPHS